MSENENVSGTTGEAGPAGPAGPAGRTDAGWGWEPVPQGGEYDSDATAFVKLPQDMLDALGTGEPLAAPGHGYVPPPMIVPLGSASADPAATGTWAIPVQWPGAGTTPQAGTGAGGGGGAGAPAPAPVGGPIPASIPIPASVAAAFADQRQGQVSGHGQEFGQGRAHAQAQAQGQGQAAGHGPASAEAGHDPGATAEWRFPEAVQDSEPVTTGQWTLGTRRGDRRVPARRSGGRLEPGSGDAAGRSCGPLGEPPRLRGRGSRASGYRGGCRCGCCSGCCDELGRAARRAVRRG